MAIFKILEGPSSRIDLATTPFHKGWAYFTPDDGGLYIDTEIDGVQKRIRVSGGSTAINATLPASGWVSGKQTISVSGITATSNGMISVAQEITDEQMDAAKDAELFVCAQGNGTITVEAAGEVPPVDIPVLIVLTA